MPVGRKLKYGILFTSIILVVELIGGFLSHSLALLSDAGHVFADVIALSLSWYGVKQAERPASMRMTFGYHRVGVIIALFNAVSIFAIAAIIFYEAYRRWLHPLEINSPLMLGVALVGLSVNIFVAVWLRKEQRSNLNVRLSQATDIRKKVEKVLRQQFDIEHSALQMECQECGTTDLYCSLTPRSQTEDQAKHKG